MDQKLLCVAVCPLAAVLGWAQLREEDRAGIPWGGCCAWLRHSNCLPESRAGFMARCPTRAWVTHSACDWGLVLTEDWRSENLNLVGGPGFEMSEKEFDLSVISSCLHFNLFPNQSSNGRHRCAPPSRAGKGEWCGSVMSRGVPGQKAWLWHWHWQTTSFGPVP